jgi:hypothetical protein
MPPPSTLKHPIKPASDYARVTSNIPSNLPRVERGVLKHPIKPA